MLALVRVNDPLRLLFVFVVFCLIRFPLIFGEFPLFLDELKAMLLGERLNQDARLYVDVWDNCSPLFGVCCELIDTFFGRYVLSYRLLAFIAVGFQAFWFNGLFIKRDVTTERTYLPALLYIVFMSAIPDFWILSPALLSLTFLIISLRSVVSINEYTTDASIFGIGVSMGIAIAFFLPTAVFALWLFIGLLVFRTTDFRQYLLIFYAAAFVLLVLMIWMYAEQLMFEFWKDYVLAHLPLTGIWRISLDKLLIISVLPVSLLAIAFFRTRLYQNYINFQLATQQVMFVWATNAIFVFLFSPEIEPALLMFFVPVLVFFVTSMLLLIERKWLAEVLMAVIVLVSVLNIHNNVSDFFPKLNVFDFKTLCAQPADNFPYSDKKLLVLGPDLSYYQKNKHCMPYLNWSFSQDHWAHLDEYQTLETIMQLFLSEKPEVVVDKEKLFPVLSNKLPLLKELYQPSKQLQDVYLLAPNK